VIFDKYCSRKFLFMQFQYLIDDRHLPAVPGFLRQAEITSICCDSRRVVVGSLFVGLQGLNGHGGQFAPEALARGARAVVLDRTAQVSTGGMDGFVLRVDDARQFLVEALRRFYEDPSRRIRTIGVTGTNGKTTITYLLESIFRSANHKSGMIGTIKHRIGSRILAAHNTTPGIVDNFHYLWEMAGDHLDYCLMEVSSHALTQGRVAGIHFQGAIFTNLTGDHLDYHKDQEDYFQAKARLFRGLSPESVAVLNQDDAYARRLTAMTPARILTYGIDSAADVRPKDVQGGLDHSRLTVAGMGKEIPIKTCLFGRYNIYNILAAVGFCLCEGIPEDCIRQGIEALTRVPGRMEHVPTTKGFYVFIDFAHTADAMKNVLAAIREAGAKRIILVFGCGGDRDRTKRPLMAEAASRAADFSLVTTDNPRSENPKDIAADITQGFTTKNYRVILDRREAIRSALAMAQKDDVVLIAGKGHEDYQIFKDKTIPFHEREIVEQILASV